MTTRCAAGKNRHRNSGIGEVKEAITLELKKISTSGTMESSDIMITLEPCDCDGIEIELSSSVYKQFGEEIRKVISETLLELGIKSARIKAVDKGALNCVIRARTKTAAYRAGGVDEYAWGDVVK